MANSAIHAAIAELRAQRDMLNEAIDALEAAAGGSARGLALAGVPKKRGRPRKTSSGTRKQAPRGLLKNTIHKILRDSGKPLKPVQVRDLVLKSGYPSENPKSLYVSVYTKLKEDSQVKKMANGTFALRAGAGGASKKKRR